MWYRKCGTENVVQKTAKFRVSSVKHKSFFVCLAGWLVCWFKKCFIRGLLVGGGGGDVVCFFLSFFLSFFLLLLFVCVCFFVLFFCLFFCVFYI